MKHLRSIQQGAPDGLCGLYSILNFLNLHLRLPWRPYVDIDDGSRATTKSASPEERLFRELIFSAHDTGDLLPEAICTGFSPERLKRIYDKFLERNGLNGYARDVEREEGEDVFSLATKLLDEQRVDHESRGLLATLEDGSHWILISAAQDDGSLRVLDSSEAPEALRYSRRHHAQRRANERNLTIEGAILLTLKPGRYARKD